MNKIFTFSLAALLGLSACALAAFPAKADAEEAYTGPNFTEDFESYKVKTDNGYDSKQIAAKWQNGWLDPPGPDEVDSEGADDKFSIETDPTDPANKVLHMDTATKNSSFFYLTIKDDQGQGIRVKNFEVSFRFLCAEGGEAYWFGIASRKAADTRYNGTNCVMMNARVWDQATFRPDAYRQLGMSGLQLKLKNQDRSADFTPMDIADIYADWHTYKLVVQDNEFDMFIDGSHFGGATITQTSANKHGYLSLVSTVANVYIDDFQMVNKDIAAPPDEGEPDPEPTPDVSPVLTGEKEFTVTAGEKKALTVGLDTKDQVIVKVDANKRGVMSKYYSYADKRFTLSADYMSGLDAGEYEFLVGTDGGEVAFKVTVTEAAGGGGCGSSVLGGGTALVGLGLTAVGVLSVHKKKS